MNFIISSNKLETEFQRLMLQYKYYYWATAWAGVSTTLFSTLLKRKDKIKKLVVGIHFYQTHPDFIATFLNHSKVKFIKQPAGTFHPKLYLFYDNAEKWELLVSSANFTNEAFTRNTEATIVIKSSDDNSKSVLKNAFQLVDKSWDEATKFNKSELMKYTISWKNHRPKVNSLSGRYGGSTDSSKPIHTVTVSNMIWKEFILKVMEDRRGIKNRIQLILKCKELFESKTHFNLLDVEERKFIAGIPHKFLSANNLDNGWFGSMQGAGYFKNRIIENDINISKALDQIPLQGQITYSQYEKYINYFRKSLTGNNIATSSRLLAMKRPDTFVCLDSKNKSNLCEAFGIKQSEMTYKRYWDDIIERIFDSNWWVNPAPKNELEEQISNARAAFLDSLYYEY